MSEELAEKIMPQSTDAEQALLAAIFLNKEAIYEAMQILTKSLERDFRLNRKFLMMDFLPILKRQEEILKSLNTLSNLLKEKRNMDILTSQELIVSLMFTMFINAEIRRKQEKYDMATLLLYRLLEMIEQRRLTVHNLYVSKMNYADIAYFRTST